jgi:hypothetical protein
LVTVQYGKKGFMWFCSIVPPGGSICQAESLSAD